MAAAGAGAPTTALPLGRNLRRHRRGAAPLLIVVMQARLDGTRWQVVPAYCAALTCSAVGYVGRTGVLQLPTFICRLVATAGTAATVMSTAAGRGALMF
jgi:hypothetical protein